MKNAPLFSPLALELPEKEQGCLWEDLAPAPKKEKEFNAPLLTDSPPINHIYRIVGMWARGAQKGSL
jgi:hypothetical protein